MKDSADSGSSCWQRKKPANEEKYVRDIVELKLWLDRRQATPDTVRECTG